MPSPHNQQRSSDASPARARRPALDKAEQQAYLVLDENGTIQHVSAKVRNLLNLGSRSLTGESVFSRVHPRQLNRVLHNLTEMTVRNRERATWLLRLKTDLGPWQWFKVEAENRDDRAGIVLHLYERGGGN